MPRTPDGVAALEQAHIVDGEADAAAGRGGEKHVVQDVDICRRCRFAVGAFRNIDASRPADRHPHDAVALVELHGDLAVAVDVFEVHQTVAAHVAVARGEHQFQGTPGLVVLRQRQDGGDDLAFRQGQQVDQRLADGLGRRRRQTPHLHAIDHAARGEEQDRRVRRGDEDLRDHVLVARRHARAAFAAAALGAIGGERHALDVAAVADGHHHVLALDQVLVLDLALHLDDVGHDAGCRTRS